jgi:hypothetical protein
LKDTPNIFLNSGSDSDLLYFVERDLVLSPIVQLRRARRSAARVQDSRPSAKRLEATEQGRALSGGSCSLVLKSFLASGFLQRGKLQGGILVLGRDAGVTVFHALLFASNLKHQT